MFCEPVFRTLPSFSACIIDEQKSGSTEEPHACLMLRTLPQRAVPGRGGMAREGYCTVKSSEVQQTSYAIINTVLRPSGTVTRNTRTE